MHSRTQDCTHTVIQVPMPARTPPCPAMPSPIRPSRGGGRWGSVILGEEVARRVSGEVGHRVGRRVGRVDGRGGRWGEREGGLRGARRGSRGGQPGGRKWRCGSGECGEKAGEEVDEEGEHASTKVRERGGGSTVSMHTCTHAHVCTATHSVLPTPSSASPRVTHACTHTHPYCHVPVRPSDGPAHCLAYFAIVLPVLPCTPAHSRTPVRPSPQLHPPVHTLATHAHPVQPRLAPTLAMPSPSTNKCKSTCIHHLSHALPPSSNLALMPNLVLHARDHEYARTHTLALMSHPTRTHARVACLFVLFSCNTFFSSSFVYTMHRIFVCQVANKEGT